MTLFHSLNQRYESQEAEAALSQLAWPGVFRDSLPDVTHEDFQFSVGIENQHAKLMQWKQIMTLPAFNESRRITSKAGWTYYGHWKGLTFQTLFSLFSTPALYPWVRLESLTGEVMVVERMNLSNWRIITESEGKLLSPLYGGPLLLHNFDYYMEYSMSNLAKVVLMQGNYEPLYPFAKRGLKLDDARVKPGQYYAVHQEKLSTI